MIVLQKKRAESALESQDILITNHPNSSWLEQLLAVLVAAAFGAAATEGLEQEVANPIPSL